MMEMFACLAVVPPRAISEPSLICMKVGSHLMVQLLQVRTDATGRSFVYDSLAAVDLCQSKLCHDLLGRLAHERRSLCRPATWLDN